MKNIVANFDREVASVDNLLRFDEMVVAVPIKGLNKISELAEKHNNQRIKEESDKYLRILSNISDNHSLKSYYETIYNQCVVLLVSYFGATLEELFRMCIPIVIQTGEPKNILKEEVKISVQDLAKREFILKDDYIDYLVEKNILSFQDMKNTRRTFEKYLDVILDKNQIMNNIIFGQASRHIIVHSGGRITSKFKGQIEVATPRTIMPEMKETGLLKYNPEEVKILGDSMKSFMQTLKGELNKYCDDF